jgi:hypothetical protein
MASEPTGQLDKNARFLGPCPGDSVRISWEFEFSTSNKDSSNKFGD